MTRNDRDDGALDYENEGFVYATDRLKKETMNKIVKHLDEVIKDFAKDGVDEGDSLKIRPDFDDNKYYLTFGSGPYDENLEGYIYGYMVSKGLHKKFLPKAAIQKVTDGMSFIEVKDEFLDSFDDEIYEPIEHLVAGCMYEAIYIMKHYGLDAQALNLSEEWLGEEPEEINEDKLIEGVFFPHTKAKERIENYLKNHKLSKNDKNTLIGVINKNLPKENLVVISCLSADYLDFATTLAKSTIQMCETIPELNSCVSGFEKMPNGEQILKELTSLIEEKSKEL